MSPRHLNDKGYPLDYHDGSLKYLGQLRLDFYKNSVDRVLDARSLRGDVDGHAWRGADERRLRQIRLSAGPNGRPARESLRRSSGRSAVEATRELRQSEQFKQHCSDEQIWTNYEYMEVFDQLAQYVCNRYPLNSKARKLGPTDTLERRRYSDQAWPASAVKIKIDTVARRLSCGPSVRLDPFQYPSRAVRTEPIGRFLASSTAPSGSR